MRRAKERSRILLDALCVMLVALASCGTETPSPRTPDESSAPPSATTSPAAFHSDRHGYRIDIPPGWNVTEFPGTWTSLEQFSPGAEVPAEDVLSSPAGSAFLVANSMPIPGPMTAAEWLEAFDRLVEEGIDPSCPATKDEGSVDGEPAVVREQQCEGMTIVGRSLVHAGRGYYFTIGFPDDEPSTGAALEEVVESIRFVDR